MGKRTSGHAPQILPSNRASWQRSNCCEIRLTVSKRLSKTLIDRSWSYRLSWKVANKSVHEWSNCRVRTETFNNNVSPPLSPTQKAPRICQATRTALEDTIPGAMAKDWQIGRWPLVPSIILNKHIVQSTQPPLLVSTGFVHLYIGFRWMVIFIISFQLYPPIFSTPARSATWGTGLAFTDSQLQRSAISQDAHEKAAAVSVQFQNHSCGIASRRCKSKQTWVVFADSVHWFLSNLPGHMLS